MRRVAFFLVTTGLLAAAFLYRPTGPSICATKLAGFSCPGCGLVRSVTSFARGRFAESVELHLFGPLAFATMAALWGIAAWGLARGRDYRAPTSPAFASTLGGTLVLLLGYWAARVATGTVP